MSKYHNVRTAYRGRVFDSAAEARYARILELRQRAGEVSTWTTQVDIPLMVNGQRVCTYRADFAVTFTDGHLELHK
jgi:uncharacterized protein DUF1064